MAYDGQEREIVEDVSEKQSADISFNVNEKKKKRDSGSVAVLSALCITLLLIVSAAAAFLLARGVTVVTGSDGRSVIVIGLYDKNSTPYEMSGDATADGSDPSESDGFDLPVADIPANADTLPLAYDGKLTTAEIAEKVRPSVVGITAGKRFGSALGSGVIMTADGYIVTNHHVVDGAEKITVFLENGDTYEAAIVGSDKQTDIAVLKIDARNLPAAEFGDSDRLRVGDLAVAIGTPYDLSLMGTTTQGIISAINRDIVYEDSIFTLIQTDASINPGNSGGPLVNEFGQVVGITSMKIGQNFEGLGFAIPINTARPIINELVNNGRVTSRPILGITGNFLNDSRAAMNNVPVGIFITSVNEKSDASAKGLAEGDIITSIDGKTFSDLASFRRIIAEHKVGDTVTLTVYRDADFYDNIPGATLTFEVKLMDESILD